MIIRTIKLHLREWADRIITFATLMDQTPLDDAYAEIRHLRQEVSELRGLVNSAEKKKAA